MRGAPQFALLIWKGALARPAGPSDGVDALLTLGEASVLWRADAAGERAS